jgi:hypothetical protein
MPNQSIVQPATRCGKTESMLLFQDIAFATLDCHLIDTEAEESIAKIRAIAASQTKHLKERIAANHRRLCEVISATKASATGAAGSFGLDDGKPFATVSDDWIKQETARVRLG